MIVYAKLGCGCCTDGLTFDTIESANGALRDAGLNSCATIVDDAGETHVDVDTFYGFSLTEDEEEARGLQFLAEQAFGKGTP